MQGKGLGKQDICAGWRELPTWRCRTVKNALGQELQGVLRIPAPSSWVCSTKLTSAEQL